MLIEWISWDFCKLLIPKFHRFLHILIKLIWFVSWASGLGSSPGKKAVKGNGEIIAFHHGVPKGPRTRFFRWSSRPRGKGHLPALVTKKKLFLSFICWIPRPVNFSSSFLFFYLLVTWSWWSTCFLTHQMSTVTYSTHFLLLPLISGFMKILCKQYRGEKRNSRDISTLHGFPWHLICIQRANSTQIPFPSQDSSHLQLQLLSFPTVFTML